jgi:hypothetical protein
MVGKHTPSPGDGAGPAASVMAAVARGPA